ncbi:hypothetical protein IAD21_00568 [Abditibacteriota bacterium]|nr:hypothetical protein IAD21_00568 [Abditibacteriota bacterium]
MNQLQILAQILYRHEAGTVADIEKAFHGVEMEPEVREAYEPIKQRVQAQRIAKAQSKKVT